MKWGILISFLCLISFAELKNLPRRYRHVDQHHKTMKLPSVITPEEFAGAALALYAQSVQHATFEEVNKLKDAIVAIYQKCAADEQSDPECTKPLTTVFLDVLCHDEEISKKYELNDCCAKADPERNECMLSHKNSSVGYVPAFVPPTAEEACNAYHNDRHAVLAHYLYELARRYPITGIGLLFHATKQYEQIFVTCCETAEKETCFRGKAKEARKQFRESVDEQEDTCFILNNYGKDALGSWKFVEIIDKFFSANQATVTHIAKDVVHIHEETCKGDTLQSLLDRIELTDYICENKNTISPKLDKCCDLSLVERTKCIIALENDEKPAGPHPPHQHFINEAEACKSYAEHGEEHLASFLFDLARSHPEFSKVLDAEIFLRYKFLLEKCCKLEDHVQCLHTGEEQIESLVTKIQDVVKKNCDQYNKIGAYFFQNELLVKYAKIMPQLPSSILIEYTKKFAKVAEKCCHLDSDHQSSCALEGSDKGMGFICKYHKKHPINKQVCQCCDHPFITRWECISGLGPDPSYVPPSVFKPHAMDAPEGLCSPDEETAQENKQGLLIDVLEFMPHISDAQLANATIGFHMIQTQCCEAENKRECFDKESKPLIHQVQAGLVDH